MKWVINSADRADKSQPVEGPYVWECPLAAPKNVRQMRLSHVSIPKTIYNVVGDATTPINNAFWITDGLNDNLIVVPAGIYDGTTLSTAINVQLAASADFPNLVSTFDVTTGKLWFKTSSGSYEIAFFTGYAEAQRTFGLPTGGQNSASLAYTFWPYGQEDGTPVYETIDTASEFYFPYVVQLTSPEYLLLRLDVGQGSGGDVQVGSARFTFVIPMREYTYGEIVRYDINAVMEQNDKVQNLRPDSITVSWYPHNSEWLPYWSYQDGTYPGAGGFNGADHSIVLELL